jgi:glycosyltransferase involved in cell wall biosynthesis
MEEGKDSAPLRVLVMTDTLINAGAERVAVDIARGLDRARFEPVILVTRYGGPLQDVLDREGLSYEILGRKGRLSIAPWIQAHRLARSCDVIHSHKFGSNVWGALLSRTSRRPLIAHDHNWVDEEGRMYRFLMRWWIGRRARRMLCVSDGVAQRMRDYGIPDHKIQVLHHGVPNIQVESREDARGELNIPMHAAAIGIIAALRPVKAHDLLLRAVARLQTRDPRPGLWIVGDGPERDNLIALADELGIAHATHWVGEHPDAARIVRAFDVAVLCSHSEGLPLSVLEAMRAGVPVVASDVGGLTLLLADGAGALVPPGDAKQLAATLSRVLDSPDRCHAMVQLAAERVFYEYSYERGIATLGVLYDTVTGRWVEDDPDDTLEQRAA